MKFLKEVKADDILRAGSVMFFATILSSGINYFYHIIIGRALGSATYGEFGALFALSFFLSFILIRTLSISTAGFISKFKGQNNSQIIPLFHSTMCFYMMILGVVAFIIFSLFSGFIADFLHIDSIIIVVFIGVVFLFSWLLPVNLGTIQGLQRFNHFALNNIIQAVSKFIIGVGLVLIGFGIYGAVGGLVFGIIIALITSFYFLRDSVRLPSLRITSSPTQSLAPNSTSAPNLSHYSVQDLKFDLKDVYRVSFYVLLAVTCLTIPTNIDVILVKHFFTSEDTGLYTAASIFGRLIFFLTVAITTVMYPKVVEAHTKNNDTSSILRKSMIYTGIPTGLLAISFSLFPEFFLGIFYGNEYLEAESLLKLYGPLMFFFSLTTVLVYYNLAKNRYGFIYLFTSFSIIELGLICVYHSSLSLILQIFLMMNIILFVISWCVSYSYPEIKNK